MASVNHDRDTALNQEVASDAVGSISDRRVHGDPDRTVARQEALPVADGPDRARPRCSSMLPLVWAFNQLGWHAAAQVPFWIGPILLYIVLPALDLRYGPDGQNPPDEVMERLENDKYYRWCTYVFIPIQYAALIFSCWIGAERRH